MWAIFVRCYLIALQLRQVSIEVLTVFDIILRRFRSHHDFSTLRACAFGNRVALTPPVRRSNMFKISIVDTPAQRRLVVEGRLSEPWINELRATWRNTSRDLAGRKLVIDLS